MGTVKGEYHTQYAAGGATNLVTNVWNNCLRTVYDTYTVVAATAMAAGSTIAMGIIPKGAIVLGFIWTSTAASAAVTADITIGDVAATTSEALTDMTSATQQFVPATGVFPYTPLTADSAVSVITAAQTMPTGQIVTLTTLYLMDIV